MKRKVLKIIGISAISLFFIFVVFMVVAFIYSIYSEKKQTTELNPLPTPLVTIYPQKNYADKYAETVNAFYMDSIGYNIAGPVHEDSDNKNKGYLDLYESAYLVNGRKMMGRVEFSNDADSYGKYYNEEYPLTFSVDLEDYDTNYQTPEDIALLSDDEINDILLFLLIPIYPNVSINEIKTARNSDPNSREILSDFKIMSNTAKGPNYRARFKMSFCIQKWF